MCEKKLLLVELTDFHSIRQGHGSSVMDESDVENRSHCRFIETWKGLASMCGMHLAAGGSDYCYITNIVFLTPMVLGNCMYFLCPNSVYMMSESPTPEKSCGCYVVLRRTHINCFMDPGSNLPCL